MRHASSSGAEPVLRAARVAIGALASIPRSTTGPLRIAVALSGGRDSIALLDAPRRRRRSSA